MTERTLLVALLGVLSGCTFKPDPDSGRFTCSTSSDCGSGYTCVVQQDGTKRSLCFKTSEIAPESCNDADDDKDGVVDNGFDLNTDNNNCGTCGKVCPAGTKCVGGACAETACSDGADNDGDGLTDCADPDCLGQACDDADVTKNCGVRANSSPACVPRESNCSDGKDNDGDGKTDCEDSDCEGSTCAEGKVCSSGVCS